MTGIERERVGGLPIWAWALLTGLAVWLLYVFTLGPTTAFWDTSEYIATAYILGVPHPPGNPLFVVLGRAWLLATAWTGLEVAARINLLSATASAAAAVFWFLAVLRIWAHFTKSRSIALIAGFMAVLVGATAYTVWAQSNVNEKVYTVSLLFVAVITYLAMLWEDHSDSFRGGRLVVLVSFLLGLGATNHQMSLMPLPALAMFVLWHNHERILSWRAAGLLAGAAVAGALAGAGLDAAGLHVPRLWLILVALTAGSLLLSTRVAAAAVAFAVIGYSVQLLFVPIRSAQNPIIDEADPECARIVDAITPAQFETAMGELKLLVRCEALAASMAREQYMKPPLTERQAPLKAQFANYWQYFDWQWARTLAPGARSVVTLVFVALGLIGLARHARGDPDSFVYFVTLLLTITVLLVYYLNFRYGYSLNPEVPLDRHEVRERDYFFILSFNVWGLYVGMGIVAAWRWLAARVKAGADPSRGLRLASPVLGVALIPLFLNFPLADRRGDYSARDWAYNLLQSVEPYGVVFTNGDNDTFPLWYLQEVEGIRRDVTVIVHSYLGTKWYPKQLRDLTRPCAEGVDPLATPSVIVCQRPFDADAAVEPYRDLPITAPTRGILSMTDEELERLPVFDVVPAGFVVEFSPRVRIEFGADRILSHSDFLVYRIVRESLGDRPVYFAATAPPVYQLWNLQPHLVRHGLAYKLIDGPMESTTDRVELDVQFDVPWIDLQRSHELLWDVFQLEYLLDWVLWPEPSTRASIPAQYYIAHIALGEAHRLRENPAQAEEAYRRGERLFSLAGRSVP